MYDLRQKEKTFTEYYTKIQSLWDEIDSMRAAPPLTENNAEISTYVRVMQQEREEEKSEEALTFSRLWRFLSSSVSFSSFDSAMAKKKKASSKTTSSPLTVWGVVVLSALLSKPGVARGVDRGTRPLSALIRIYSRHLRRRK